MNVYVKKWILSVLLFFLVKSTLFFWADEYLQRQNLSSHLVYDDFLNVSHIYFTPHLK